MKTVKYLLVNMYIIAFVATMVYAGEEIESYQNAQQKVINRTVKEVQNKAEKEITQEAAAGITLSYKALSLLKENKTDEAREILLEASKNINDMFKEEDIVPVDSNVRVLMGVTRLDEAHDLMRLAKEALEKNNPRRARELLNPLVNEIDITTTCAPLYTYKSYINEAVVSLDKKEDKAKSEQSLINAFETVIKEVEIIPVAPMIAHEFLMEADILVKEDAGKSLQLVKEANEQLKLNTLLGYSVAKDLKKEMGKVKREVRDEQFKHMHDSISEKIKEIENKLAIHKPKEEEQIQKELDKTHEIIADWRSEVAISMI